MSEGIMRDIRQRLDIDPNDKSHDTDILEMSPDEQFRLYCEWNGLFYWSNTLSEVVLELFKGKK